MTKSNNKYDVFHKRTVSNLKDTPMFLYRRIRLINLENKMAELKKKMQGKDALSATKYKELETLYDALITRVLIDSSSILKLSANITYETVKDLQYVNSETLKKYLEEYNISPSSFHFWIENKITEAIYFIALYGILEKKGKKIEEFSQEEVLTLISSLDTSNYSAMSLDAESQKLLEKIMKVNFNYKDLSDEERDFIDGCHEAYMDEEINPYVETNRVPDKDVLKSSRKIYFKN